MDEKVIDVTYQTYKFVKNFIEKREKCCEKDHVYDEYSFENFKKAIEIFDGLGRGYAERYEKEKKNEFG